MNNARSTIAGLKSQGCPGGGWNGMPAEIEGVATVADCLAHDVCGCIYGDAVQHIEQLQAALKPFVEADWYADGFGRYEGKMSGADLVRAKRVDQQSAPEKENG